MFEWNFTILKSIFVYIGTQHLFDIKNLQLKAHLRMPFQRTAMHFYLGLK